VKRTRGASPAVSQRWHSQAAGAAADPAGPVEAVADPGGAAEAAAATDPVDGAAEAARQATPLPILNDSLTLLSFLLMKHGANRNLKRWVPLPILVRALKLAAKLWAGVDPMICDPMKDRDIFDLLGFD
jgi:hypothetical protein